jgi:GT2 family glycosyltransferase
MPVKSAPAPERVSVIVPVWNGASVIAECLQATLLNSGPFLHEIICIDNASTDGSAGIVAQVADHYPQVRLLSQPTNLGFGGGVNVGLAVATGDLCILLNQDCLPQPGWLDALCAGLRCMPHAGIAGCTLRSADGHIDHAGARISRPLALGEHLTDTNTSLTEVDYVTGAIFAITSATRQAVGNFDAAFFPAYYEESDYCYRARAKGFTSIYVPAAVGIHIRSSREWQRDGLTHAITQHRSRYRFVLKHFSDAELSTFFLAEQAAAAEERHSDQALGRVIAGRAILRALAEIEASRMRDLALETSSTRTRLSQTHLTAIVTQSLNHALTLHTCDDAAQQKLRDQTRQIMRKIFFRDPQPTEPESRLSRALRMLVKRPLSILSGREIILQSQLNSVNAARNDLLQRRASLLEKITRHDLL